MMGSNYVVDRVLVGGGSCDSSRKTIQKGKLYGATGLHGGNESIWPVSQESLQISLSSLAALSQIALSPKMTDEQKIGLQY